jgi:hypothetical protein
VPGESADISCEFLRRWSVPGTVCSYQRAWCVFPAILPTRSCSICSLSRTRHFSWHIVEKKILATWVHDRSSSKACPEMLSSLDFCRMRRDTWEHLVSTRVRTYGRVCPRSDVEPWFFRKFIFMDMRSGCGGCPIVNKLLDAFVKYEDETQHQGSGYAEKSDHNHLCPRVPWSAVRCCLSTLPSHADMVPPEEPAR